MSSSKRIAVLAISNLMILAACGGGSMTPPPPAPIFSTSPSTVAAENAAYTYSPKASDPAGGSTTLTLPSGPAGAVLSAGTVSWTPTPAQSRVANQFTLEATSSKGGRATQSWTVTPSGTVSGSWIDTYLDGRRPGAESYQLGRLRPHPFSPCSTDRRVGDYAKRCRAR